MEGLLSLGEWRRVCKIAAFDIQWNGVDQSEFSVSIFFPRSSVKLVAKFSQDLTADLQRCFLSMSLSYFAMNNNETFQFRYADQVNIQ